MINKFHFIQLSFLLILFSGCMGDTTMKVTLGRDIASEDGAATPTPLTPSLALSNLPSDPSNAALAITVGGTNVAEYAYDIIAQAANCTTAIYSGWTNISTQITEAVVDGAYKLCVKGKSSTGVESSVTEHTWTRDTSAPQFIFQLRDQGTGFATTTGSLNVNAVVTTSTGTPSHYCYQLSSSTPSVSAGCWNTGTTQAVTISGSTSTVYGWAKDTAGNISASSSDTIFYFAGNCPSGYVPVAGNTDLGTNSFCVMAYEAKNNGSSVAVSTSTGNPWVSITQTNAWTECDDLNTEAAGANRNNDTNGDGTYALISNREWMTIARDAENVAANWSGSGGVGDGVMARGWAAHTVYGDAWVNTAVAPSTGPNCLYNTGANACAATGNMLYRRTLILSNGSEVWDIGANVYEWVNWNTGGALASGPTTCPGAYAELPAVACGALVDADYNTDNGTFDSTDGMGRFYGGAGGAALRGAGWGVGTGRRGVRAPSEHFARGFGHVRWLSLPLPTITPSVLKTI